MATRRKSSPTRAKPVPRITSPAATAECGGRFMATTTGHTVKAFDDDLDELRALISQMGGLAAAAIADAVRSEERRVGEEGVSTCRSRWYPYHYKKKTTSTQLSNKPT